METSAFCTVVHGKENAVESAHFHTSTAPKAKLILEYLVHFASHFSAVYENKKH